MRRWRRRRCSPAWQWEGARPGRCMSSPLRPTHQSCGVLAWQGCSRAAGSPLTYTHHAPLYPRSPVTSSGNRRLCIELEGGREKRERNIIFLQGQDCIKSPGPLETI
ncbi:hypothetical protein AAFF_G00320050 [Aldrovandia affinis]|uniref:Uncharacterized protein n=1 Tax=Aldrovandia affinis TaxID=143900 RepID=A0AAD7SNZ1_9TELE|nr:hypothetical protein AAFF_G00320050 [Aldrovandia affinis]